MAGVTRYGFSMSSQNTDYFRRISFILIIFVPYFTRYKVTLASNLVAVLRALDTATDAATTHSELMFITVAESVEPTVKRKQFLTNTL